MNDPRKRTIASVLKSAFFLDLRSLALFRITLGSILLVDLLFRWSTLKDMYTADGFFNWELADRYYRFEFGEHWQQYAWSVYWISDSEVFVKMLFGMAAVAALFLIVGKWTRVATVVSWLLLVSLHVRNPLITTSGDFLFKMMLFWSMFLPLGARWSMDSAGQEKTYSAICSFATIGFVVQLFAIYFFPGIAKCNEIWLQGDAMWYVLRLDIYITEFGRSMLEYPRALKWVSWATLFAELIWVWTLFSPWRNGLFRIVNALVFCSFHISIALSMSIGLFSFICVTAWIALLPPFIWSRNDKNEAEVLDRTRFDSASTFQLAGEVFCVFALILVIACNLSNINSAPTKKLRIPLLQQLANQLGIFQEFQMFGDPPKVNPWFVYEAKLENGERVDLFRNEPVQMTRPQRGLEKMPQFHWRRLHRSAVHSRRKVIREPMLLYMVRKWNESHDESEQVVTARLLFFKEKIGPEFNELNFASVTWGSFEDETRSAGNLFDSLLENDVPF